MWKDESRRPEAGPSNRGLTREFPKSTPDGESGSSVMVGVVRGVGVPAGPDDSIQDRPGSGPRVGGACCGIPHPTRPESGGHSNPAQIRQVRAGGRLEERSAAGSFTYAFPSCSPDPHHLTVLARPGLVRAASTLPGVARIRLPSASTRLLRQTHGGVLSPPQGSRTPRGARCRSTRPGRGARRRTGARRDRRAWPRCRRGSS
jgi:hypothetical protein